MKKDYLPFAQRAYHISIVELFQLLYSKFFVILECLNNFLHDLLEHLCFSSLILYIASSFPFKSDQSIDLHDKSSDHLGLELHASFKKINVSIPNFPVSSVQFSVHLR